MHTAIRCGLQEAVWLKFAKAKVRVEQPNSVYALGREARRAGLTVIAIQEIGRERGVSQ